MVRAPVGGGLPEPLAEAMRQAAGGGEARLLRDGANRVIRFGQQGFRPIQSALDDGADDRLAENGSEPQPKQGLGDVQMAGDGAHIDVRCEIPVDVLECHVDETTGWRNRTCRLSFDNCKRGDLDGRSGRSAAHEPHEFRSASSSKFDVPGMDARERRPTGIADDFVVVDAEYRDLHGHLQLQLTTGFESRPGHHVVGGENGGGLRQLIEP